MKLIGMMPVRNEDWCLGLTLRAALLWCDEVVVLLHACTDRSQSIVREIFFESGERITIMHADGERWDEMTQRQMMLETARKRGATHLAIIDADEILDGNMATMASTGRFKDIVFGTPENAILELPGYNLRGGIQQYHSNGVWGNRWFSTAFVDAPDLGWSGDRFHHREPGPRKLSPYQPIPQGQGGVMHLWGSSERRLIAKHALYKVTEHTRKMHHVTWIDREYSLAIHGDPQQASYGTPATWTYSPVPDSWWAPYAHLMKYLDVDKEPWQEAEVRRLVAEHGRDKFSGLDLFGVA